MKLRIKGNSIRLRLTVSEVETFGETGGITDSINFGSGEEGILEYSLVSNKGDGVVTADLGVREIIVSVPELIARRWVASEQVGFGAVQNLGGGSSLSILVEKDFVRRKFKETEDESDNYPHPNP